jgi:hypothetical protein
MRSSFASRGYELACSDPGSQVSMILGALLASSTWNGCRVM